MTESTSDFNLQPDPRILPMLGEINLSQWRCLAELVDNAVDGFLSATREGISIGSPEVHISLPESNSASAIACVRDNGPGMSPETLEKAVRAGWTGNTPVDSLGMFGMGFNISTARLGTATTVWTARKDDIEWHGLRIDFETLQKQRHFRTPHLTREKVDPHEHGTEITIDSLKAEHRAWLSRTANRSRIARELSKTYSSMLRDNGYPIGFSLFVNGNKVKPRYPCIWDRERTVTSPRLGTVFAYQVIERELSNRPFCLACWQWLPNGQEECSCGRHGSVVDRPRRVTGWLGIQRYLSNTDFGIDFVRNGRKIETENRELFVWQDDDGQEPEYPIDDPRGRGRIVGEIHIDHCRVNYAKDRFDRNDPAWEEMVDIVRGRGPLRPDKARDLGFGPNGSPLFQLFQCFRRSTPKPKVAGSWRRLLIVSDNNAAESMASKFHAGEAEYQDDAKWLELVKEQDDALLVKETVSADEENGELEGFTDETDEEGTISEDPNDAQTPSPTRSPIASLSREYRHDRSSMLWEVRAWAVEGSDKELGGAEVPWRLHAAQSGEYSFFVNTSHVAFRSSTLTPIDALLAELAWSAKDFLRGAEKDMPFGLVLADLRDKYAGSTKLDPVQLSAEASLVLSDLAKNIPSKAMDAADARALFEEFGSTEQEAILQKMVTRQVSNAQEAIAKGRFLEHAPRASVLKFFSRHPDLFFDGQYWDIGYRDLDYGRPSATEEAKSQIVRYYEALLFDAIWLAEQNFEEFSMEDRQRLLRASLALELLAPTVSHNGE